MDGNLYSEKCFSRSNGAVGEGAAGRLGQTRCTKFARDGQRIEKVLVDETIEITKAKE